MIKRENKSDEEVNENCSQPFAAGSGVNRSDCDSENECESIGSCFEMGENDSQIEISEVSGL